MRRYLFTRQHRLLNSSEFQHVFDHTQIRVSRGQFLMLATTNGLNNPRLGLVVRKKNLKLAVDRNLFKRICREQFRLSQWDIPAVDIVIMSRPGISPLKKAELNQLISKGLKRIAREHAKQQLKISKKVSAPE